MIDVTNLHPGRRAGQLASLEALERSTRIGQFQAGEARFLAMQGTPEQQNCAQRIVERAAK
jgi:hypothetical protein